MIKGLLVLVLLSHCSHTSQQGARATEDTCNAAALGLGQALALKAWRLPDGCTIRGSHEARLVTSASEAQTQITCKDALGIDFAANALLVTSRSWSPAQIGLDAYDDGKTVTWVSRQRTPCKNDPQPMPTPPITSAFLLSPGTRAFAERSCTVRTSCP